MRSGSWLKAGAFQYLMIGNSSSRSVRMDSGISRTQSPQSCFLGARRLRGWMLTRSLRATPKPLPRESAPLKLCLNNKGDLIKSKPQTQNPKMTDQSLPMSRLCTDVMRGESVEGGIWAGGWAASLGKDP